MKQPLTLWVPGDGKPGHENQSLGLAGALGRLRPCEIHRVALPDGGWLGRMAGLNRIGRGLPRPDVVIGAGHATHLPLLWTARKHGARSVVLMKPSLPLGWFDLCVAPEHDFEGRAVPDNVITTLGALNRVPWNKQGTRSGGLLLVGGPSASHGWDAAAMIACLERIVARGGPEKWVLTTSRRTPGGMLGELRARLHGVEILSHEETGRDWVPERLARAAEVWVSEDSVSMVYEALSSGARVGLLPVPRLAGDSRVLRGMDRLVDMGFVNDFATWESTGALAAPPRVLREADRCAAELERRLFG